MDGLLDFCLLKIVVSPFRDFVKLSPFLAIVPTIDTVADKSLFSQLHMNS